MDNVFLVFVSMIVLAGVGIYLFGPEPTVPETSVATTTITVTSTSTVSTAKPPAQSVTSTTLAKTSSTTTTIPRFVELEVDNVGKCSKTYLGKMNTVLATLPANVLVGAWGKPPNPKIYYACDEKEPVIFDRIMFNGGVNIAPGATVNNSYRLAGKCGRNQPVDDMQDCKELSIILDSQNIISMEEAEVMLASTTTTTVPRANPYLDRFRDMGYRKADLQIRWLCPTCVPAVNKIIIEEPGVKSRSIRYKQEINYVIYDPEVVELERILYLTNAGGNAKLIKDYEL